MTPTYSNGTASELPDGTLPHGTLPHDSSWPRTGGWRAPNDSEHMDLALIGIPTSRTSISASNAHLTPAAVRAALRKYSSHIVESGSVESGSVESRSVESGGVAGRDTSSDRARGFERELVLDEVLSIVDAGDCEDPDTDSGEVAAIHKVNLLAERSELVVALGGDNALTVPAALGVFGNGLGSAGLITFDAHHDLRDGRSNGSPVRRLVEAGLDPRRIVQVGIADFANSHTYRQRAKDWGITVIHRDEMHERPMADVVAEALEVAGAGGGPIHVDLDVDVCDRSVAPGCPASIPGGLQAHELRRAARLLVGDSQVRGIDIAEVDATADSPDARTVRLAALLVLEAAAGLAIRLGR